MRDIAGKIHLKTTLEKNPFVEMCDLMVYCGPDNEGIVKLEKITPGHRCLSILDFPKNAGQPMIFADG